METDILFLRTLDDLENRISSNDEYEVLLASGLIRKLFLDGDRLVDQVNRSARLKLRFEVIDTEKILETFRSPGMPEFDFVGIHDALDPTSIPNAPIKRLNRDAFFHAEVQLSKDQSFTVQDVIIHQANIAGGIHHLEPREDREIVLSTVEKTLRILGQPPGVQQLRSIGRIILRTLAPLRMILLCNRAIENNPNDIAAYYNRGTAKVIGGKTREAILDFDKAIELGGNQPQASDIYYKRAKAFIELATADLEQYLRLAPESPERSAVQKVVEQLREDE